jgi:hypothetical protein
MKRILAYFGLVVLSIGVLLFLGKHSLNFFMFTFSGDDELYAWAGLLLTSIGAVLWMIIFKWLAETKLQKTIALVMMFIALLGEFVTAGFDMYMQAMFADGFEFLPEELRSMTIVVSGLGLITGLALVLHFTGDSILEAFKDDDKDGIPNIIDPDYKPVSKPRFSRVFGKDEKVISELDPTGRGNGK